jgi:hypothetical protein
MQVLLLKLSLNISFFVTTLHARTLCLVTACAVPSASCRLCSVATPGHPEPLPLENHVRIVALTPDLQRVSFSSTTELILSPMLIKRSYRSSKASPICRKLSLALWLLWRVNDVVLEALRDSFIQGLEVLDEDQFSEVAIWRDLYALTGTLRTFIPQNQL